LAAHQHEVKKRNEDVAEVIKGLRMGTKKDRMDILNQYHHVFWCGDLNYRIDKTREEVMEICNQNRHEELLPFDQLNIERDSGNVFFGFSEGHISFKPTYKFDNHQPHNYYSEERNRVPAWCDRILWTSWDTYQDEIEQVEYNATYDVITSDHVPVYSTFRIRTDRASIQEHLANETCTITVKHLHAIDLTSTDPDGLSDPYLIISAPFLKNSGETEWISNTLNPTWNREITLHPSLHGRAFLERQILLFKVMDKDTASSDDLVGRGTVGLKSRLDGSTGFDIKIRKHGLCTGSVRGTITVEWK